MFCSHSVNIREIFIPVLNIRWLNIPFPSIFPSWSQYSIFGPGVLSLVYIVCLVSVFHPWSQYSKVGLNIPQLVSIFHSWSRCFFLSPVFVIGLVFLFWSQHSVLSLSTPTFIKYCIISSVPYLFHPWSQYSTFYSILIT
jgi:hypothetical protein